MKKKEVAKNIEEINKQLYQLKSEIGYIRRERKMMLEEEREQITALIEMELEKVRQFVKESLREISEESAGQIYRLYSEGKKVGKKIDEIAMKKVENKAMSTVFNIEKQAERRLTQNVIKRVDEETSRMKDELKAAEHRAITDELTGAFNRRYFEPRLRMEFSIANRSGDNLSLLMIDIDNFKHFNDTYGHPAGDEVLAETSHRLNDCLRQEDMLGRYGGEEFVVLLPGIGREAARATAERLRKAIGEVPYYWQGNALYITISIGLSTYPENASESSELLKSADDALLVAKRTGKNRVVEA
ncbi:MAG: diguanylate cyclase [Elusimicrobia bacterium]|nr:diguanylate cyclase [Elusimicrobiota bacterium]